MKTIKMASRIGHQARLDCWISFEGFAQMHLIGWLTSIFLILLIAFVATDWYALFFSAMKVFIMDYLKSYSPLKDIFQRIQVMIFHIFRSCPTLTSILLQKDFTCFFMSPSHEC